MFLPYLIRNSRFLALLLLHDCIVAFHRLAASVDRCSCLDGSVKTFDGATREIVGYGNARTSSKMFVGSENFEFFRNEIRSQGSAGTIIKRVIPTKMENVRKQKWKDYTWRGGCSRLKITNLQLRNYNSERHESSSAHQFGFVKIFVPW